MRARRDLRHDAAEAVVEEPPPDAAVGDGEPVEAGEPHRLGGLAQVAVVTKDRASISFIHEYYPDGEVFTLYSDYNNFEMLEKVNLKAARTIVEKGGETTYTESVTALGVKINGALSLKVSYTIKDNSKVPAGLENTDTYTAIGVEYTF